MIEVRVNGTIRTFREGTTVADLLAEIGLDRDGIAVAVDRRVVPRGEHAASALTGGCEVEVIRAVGGG